MENYWIDPKLKEGKHYPGELIGLIEMFNGGRVVQHVGKLPQAQQEKEVKAIETMFKDFFFYQARVLKFQKYFDVKITADNKAEWSLKKIKAFRKKAHKEWKKEFPSEEPLPIIEGIIKKVNGKLKLAHPQLLRKSFSQNFYLEPIAITGAKKRFYSRNRGETFTYWKLFAKVISGLNPNLVHRCAFPKCGKVFISKQRKKFHSGCGQKYLSEKAVESGFAKKWQKDYRDRLKKKAKAR
jgi:hypothetical protein